MLNLSKGGNLSLSKVGVNITRIEIGLGWDVNTDSTMKHEFDLDVFGLLVDTQNKGITAQGVFFYNNVDGKGTPSTDAFAPGKDFKAVIDQILKTSPVAVSQDNRTGQGEGDDETLYVNGDNLPKDKKIIVVVNIYEAAARKQTFGMVSNVYCRIPFGGQEIRYDLSEDFSIETGVVMAEIYWKDGELKVKALGKGFQGDANTLFTQYQ